MNKGSMEIKATEVLSCQVENLEMIEIPKHNAIYFRNTIRGGGAVIISADGTMLVANPFFDDYNKHLERFVKGERSNLI